MSRYYSVCFMGIVYCIFVIICTLVFGGGAGVVLPGASYSCGCIYYLGLIFDPKLVCHLCSF
jgi:hypothetical protein